MVAKSSSDPSKKSPREPRKRRRSMIESPSENSTQKRLKGTSFKTATEMNEAEEKIFKEVWVELTKAKAYENLTEKEGFTFFKEFFARGIRCRYGEDSEDIVRINLRAGTVVVEINEDMKSREHSENFVTDLARGLADAFFSNYLKSMRILPPDIAKGATGNRSKSSQSKD